MILRSTILSLMLASTATAGVMPGLLAWRRANEGGVLETAFITTWQTTSSPQSITLPFRTGYTYNLTVDWGDDSALDTVTAWNDASATHEYATAGTYTVTIEGVMGAWYFNNGGSVALFRTVEQWGDVTEAAAGLANAFFGASGATAFTTPIPGTWDTVELLYRTWRGCSALTNAPDVSALTNVTTLFEAWLFCSALTEAPDVSALTKVNTLQGTWYTCSSLTNAPDVNMLTNVTRLDSAWRDCTALTTAPDVSALTNVTTLASTWRNCNKLTNVPDVNMLTNVTSLSDAWWGCVVLTNAPDVSALTKVTTLATTWTYCLSLTTAPDVSALTNVTTLVNTWNGCNKLTSAPDVSALTKVTTMANAWLNCAALLTVPALPTASTALITTTSAFQNNAKMGGTVVELWDTNNFPNITAFGNTFTGCTNLTNYGDIPNNWKGL